MQAVLRTAQTAIDAYLAGQANQSQRTAIDTQLRRFYGPSAEGPGRIELLTRVRGRVHDGLAMIREVEERGGIRQLDSRADLPHSAETYRAWSNEEAVRSVRAELAPLFDSRRG